MVEEVVVGVLLLREAEAAGVGSGLARQVADPPGAGYSGEVEADLTSREVDQAADQAADRAVDQAAHGGAYHEGRRLVGREAVPGSASESPCPVVACLGGIASC